MSLRSKISLILSLNKYFIISVCSSIAAIIIILCNCMDWIKIKYQVACFFVACCLIGSAIIFNNLATKEEKKRRSKKDV